MTYETNGLGEEFILIHFKKKGFLITTAATGEMKKKAQDPNSFFGKIWFFDLTKKKNFYFYWSQKSQGLIVVENNIISTERPLWWR